MRRPADDAILPIGECLTWQEHYCRTNGSLVAAEILRAARTDIDAGGPLAAAVPAHARFGDLPGLRVMAAAHRLAIDGRAPDLAAFAPTLAGTAALDTPSSVARLHASVVAALTENAAVLDDYLGRVPQTNEVGRSRLLRIALSRIAGPTRLFEIGASAGLNLRADHLPGGSALEQGPMPPIVERVGCDLDPIDPTTADGAARLRSYVWVDDVARSRDLASAIDVARRVPATVRAQDAAGFAESLTLRPGTTTVLWHSAMWVYLPAPDRERVLAALDALGRTATSDQRLLHVSWEWQPGSDSRHALTVQEWDGTSDAPEPRTLATGFSHGTGIA